MRTLYFCPVVSFFFFFYLFSSPNLSGRRLHIYCTSTQSWCGLSANLECRSEVWCPLLAGNTGHKNDAKNRHLRTTAHLCRGISSQLRHISTIGKYLLSSNIFSTCSYNMVNFGPLAAEIGIPANFNGFRVLATLLTAKRHSSSGVSQTLRCWTGHHLYSAGRPSRWASAHILLQLLFFSSAYSAVY